MKTLKLLVLGATLMTGLTACPRDNIIFSSDPRIVRGNWTGTAKRVCANVSQTAWSPDGTKIVSNGLRTVIWDATTGARVRVIAERSNQVVWNGTNIITVSAPTYTNDGQATTLKFWNPSSGVLERSLNVPGSAVILSPDATRALVSSLENGQSSVRVISLTDGSTQRSLASGSEANSFVWTNDSKRIVSLFNAATLQATLSPPEPPPVQWKIRVWSVATGAIEREFPGEFAPNAISPDAKTLAYKNNDNSQNNLKFINLETGEVRSPATPSYSVIGWNANGSKVYLRRFEVDATEVWDSGSLKLEKTLPGSGVYGWNSSDAPADTGVSSYAQYQDCSLKILDLNTLTAKRTLDETALDALEVKFSLNATYLNENEYGITGTASVAGTAFQVRGKGNAGTRGRLLPQTPADLPPSAYLELLDSGGAVVWSIPGFSASFATMQSGPAPFYDFGIVPVFDIDRYTLKLAQTP